jgi:alanine racemase
MDYIMVDTTDIKGDVALGDEVVLIGEQGNHTITVNHMAA